MTDLILLLLTFFTMMFAVSQPDPARYPEVAQSYTQTFAADAVPVPPGSAVLSCANVPDRAADDIDYLAGVLRTAFDATPTLKQMAFRRTNQYLNHAIAGRRGVCRPGRCAERRNKGPGVRFGRRALKLAQSDSCGLIRKPLGPWREPG